MQRIFIQYGYVACEDSSSLYCIMTQEIEIGDGSRQAIDYNSEFGQFYLEGNYTIFNNDGLDVYKVC